MGGAYDRRGGARHRGSGDVVRMKFLIALGHDGTLDYWPLAQKSWFDYAARHGYDVHVESFAPERNGLGHPSWQKLPLLIHLIEECRHDWVLWADADTVVTDERLGLWEFLPLFPDEVVPFAIVSKDWNDYSPWSAGVMLWRVCPAALEFLRKAQALSGFADSGCWDQSAMHEVWRAQPEGITILPRRRLQSVPSDAIRPDDPWREGDFVCHATGTDQKAKRRILETYAQRVIR